MYQLLETKDALQGALATLPPVVADAACTLSDLIARNPSVMTEEDQLARALESACKSAIERSEYPSEYWECLADQYCHAIINVAVSILHVSAKLENRKAVLGNVAKAAALGLGVLTGWWIS